MLYEMIGIVRPGNLAEVKEITIAIGQIILRQGGVIRSIANWGVYDLPRPIARHQMKHRRGHHFVMRYDSAPRTHLQVRATMSLEPRVIHSTHVKLGDGKLDTLARFGQVQWDEGLGALVLSANAATSPDDTSPSWEGKVGVRGKSQ